MPRLPKDPEARAQVLADQAIAGFTTAQKQLEEANDALTEARNRALDDEALYQALAVDSQAKADLAESLIARNARIANRLAELTA